MLGFHRPQLASRGGTVPFGTETSEVLLSPRTGISKNTTVVEPRTLVTKKLVFYVVLMTCVSFFLLMTRIARWLVEIRTMTRTIICY